MSTRKRCRICAQLSNATNCENLFGRSQRTLLRQIEELTGLQLKNVSNLPLLICETCQDQAEFAHNFRELCIRVQQNFAETETQNQSNDSIEESNVGEEVGAETHKQKLSAEEDDGHKDVLIPQFPTSEYTNQSKESSSEEDENVFIEREQEDDVVMTAETCEEIGIELVYFEELLLKPDATNADFELLDDLNNDPEVENMPLEHTAPTTTKITEKSLESTRIKSTKNKVYSCKECDRQFNSRTTFWYHRKKHEEPPRELYKCEHCDCRFTSSRSLQHHKKKHDKTIKKLLKRSRASKPNTRNESDLYCDQCGRKFRDRRNLKEHLLRHAGIKKFQCERCPKKFVSQVEVRVHLRSHTGEQPFSCRYCDVRFKTLSGRAVHERKHTNKLPYDCSQCEMKCRTADALKNHMYTHVDERPFKCDICNTLFTRKKHLTGHYITKTHKKNVEKQKDANNETNALSQEDTSH